MKKIQYGILMSGAAVALVLAAGSAQAAPVEGLQQANKTAGWGGYGDDKPCDARLLSLPKSQELNGYITNALFLSRDQERLRGRVADMETFMRSTANRLAILEVLDSDLRKLENVLQAVRSGAITAQAIPAARDRAKVLQANVDPAYQKVRAARTKLDNITAKTKPIRLKLTKAADAARATDLAMLGMDTMLDLMPTAFQLAYTCENKYGKSGLSLAAVTSVIGAADPMLVKYHTDVVTPLLTVTQWPSTAFFDPFNEKLGAADGLREELEKLLADLKHLKSSLDALNAVMDRSFSFSFPYPNPTITDPLRVSHYTVSIGFRTIMDGAGAIQSAIESALSSFLWGILKNLGVGGYIQDLQNAANDAVNGLMSKVGFDLDLNPPDVSGLNAFEARIAGLEAAVDNFNLPAIAAPAEPLLSLPTQLPSLFPGGLGRPYRCIKGC